MATDLQQLISDVPPELLTPSVMVLGTVSLILFLAGTGLNLYFLVALRLRPPDWTSLMAAIKERPWNLQHLLIILVAVFALRSLFALYGKPFDSIIVTLAVGTLMFQGASMAIILGIIMMNRALTLIQCFGNRSLTFIKSVSYGATGYIATLPLVVIAAIAGKIVLPYFGIPPDKQDLILKFVDPACPLALKFTIAFLAIVIAPVTEEVLFRGVALPGLSKLMPVPHAVLAVSTMFAILHYNAFSFLPLTVMGIAFSLAYIRTRSLLVPIVMHTAFNTMSIISLIVLGDKASLLGFACL